MEAPAFLLELGAVIVGLAVLSRVANRLGISPIPLYLLAGLAFGKGSVFPLVTAEGFIAAGASIGVILLLLLLGLEYSAEELRTNLGRGAPAGAIDAALNFTPGLAAGLLLGWDVVGAVILGGITYMTSSGIASKLLAEMDWLGNRETPVVLSVLVIEDLAMAVYLPIVAVILRGGTLISGAISLGVALVAVSAILVVAFRHGDAVSRLVYSRSDEVLLLSILGTTVLVAGFAARFQVSAAIGAFLVGIALSGPAADRARDLLTPLRDLFAAAFFLFFGLEIDPATIPPVLGAAVLLALVTAGTKILTGVLAARRAGIGVRGRFRAGAMLVPRGEFSIAIAALGVAGGQVASLGPLAASYVLVLALIGTIAARAVDPIVVRLVRRRTARTQPPGRP